MNITKTQIKLLHTLKNALGMTEEDYRLRIIEQHGFSGTSKDLSEAEAAEIIDAWTDEAIEKGVWKKYVRAGSSRPDTGQGDPAPTMKYEDLAGRDKIMATPKQLRLIEWLWKEVSFQKGRSREDALKSFIHRLTGKQGMRFITKQDAHAVIEAMKKMMEKKLRKRRGLKR